MSASPNDKYMDSLDNAGADNLHIHYSAYSWPVNFFWQSTRLTFLQMFPMYGISILNFPHSHAFSDLCYVYSGSGYFQIEDARLPLRRGTICLVNPRVVHKVVSLPEDPLVMCNMSFELAPNRTTDKVPESYAQAETELIQAISEAKYLIAEDALFCEDYLERALQLKESTRVGDFLKFKNCMSDLFISAFQILARTDEDRVDPTSGETEQLASAIKMVYFMRDHYTEGITLNDLANALNYSPRQCQRMMQDFLGVGFSDFITAHQMRLARRLLAQTDASPEEIARQAGFRSVNAMTQQFRAAMDMSPLDYRASRQRDGKPVKYDDDLD